MSEKVQQLCEIIAKHPSKINLLNDVLKLALSQPNYPAISAVVDLMKKVSTQQELSQFLENKVRAVFVALLSMPDGDEYQERINLLGHCFEISIKKSVLIDDFLEFALKSQVQWEIGYPSNILISLFDSFIKKIQKQEEIQWEFIVSMILNLPDFELIEIQLEQHQNQFKKSFQKLLLSILASKNCPQELLKQLYHGLGMKVLSKMSQPLALSNHCINLFSQTPEIQIEILSCLFLLVGKYGLELEQFYPKLEKLIKYRTKSTSVYELPNSKRFFKLLQAALRSSKVPFKTIKKFVQILIRQIPGQIGQFAFWSLSFIVNLTKKHRKLLDEVPHMAQIKSLKHHYSSKVRKLVGELFQNLNKMDYLEIEDFTKLNVKNISEKKLSSAINSLQNDELQFKIPIFEEPL